MTREDRARKGPPGIRPPGVRPLASVIRSLVARSAVRALERAALDVTEPVWLVGGVIRDAFLGLASKDLDAACGLGAGERIGKAVARRLGGRVIVVGKAPRRIVRVVCPAVEIDLWETSEEDSESDLLRRDFTINTFRLSLPRHALTSAPKALKDLENGHLRLPRPHVLIEDPVRVLRAARFIAHFPWMTVHPTALPELREAARLLPLTAPERRLSELDRLLSVRAQEASLALRLLARWRALETLMPGFSPRQIRLGCSLVSRSALLDAGFLRILLLWSGGEDRALTTLEGWRVPGRETEVARHLFGLRAATFDSPSQKETLARFVRLVSPFERESLELLRLTGPRNLEPLLASARRVVADRRRLGRILAPPRPLPTGEIFRLARVGPSPERARLLEEVDCLLAAGAIRSAASLARFLTRREAMEA